MKLKTWSITGSIALLAIIVVLYFSQNHIKKVPIFKQSDFNSVNSVKSWKKFSEELKISEKGTKIEDFQLILDKNNHIYSVKFELVEKVNDKFTVLQYSHCYSCETEGENRVYISKSTSDEWLQYNKLIEANRFFSALEQLNQQGFFEGSKFNYHLLVSSGWTENIQVDGDYYILQNSNLKKMDEVSTSKKSKGFNMQDIGSDRPSNFSTDKETTKIVFIDS
ncbi:hypothetical protein [Neobacillus sp. LXY-1]|uniref:hypothetical protein n=1 Tax=Neobacillus sp. LXY-1 TaxID=3379133 RepID=UPI003EDF3D44